MLDTKIFSYKKYLIEAIIALVCVFIFCEYLLYYLVLIQVSFIDIHCIVSKFYFKFNIIVYMAYFGTT